MWNCEDYLEHHGIKGMHWGIRRFQNANGSLTSAGKRRYRTSGNDTGKKRDIKERLAATNEALNKPSIKRGKDKAPVSPAEQISIKTRDAANAANDIYSNTKVSKQAAEQRRVHEEAKLLSDDELKKRITRLNLEIQYKDAVRKSTIDEGYDRIKRNLDMTTSVANAAIAMAGVAAAIYKIKHG